MTGFLVRSTAAKWAKNSVLAVDAGSHLASITRILANDFPLASAHVVKERPRPRSGNGNGNGNESIREIDSPSPGTAPVSVSDDSELDSPSSEPEPALTFTTLERGAFAGLPFPHECARANALHVVREHVSTYLITHPHLDHVSGFVINTAAFHNTSRPKRLAALPFTVNAIKAHIFNNIVWPNLTDEDGGVGLVTFQRLQEGGNIALGEGSGRGYIEVCDGLGVRGFKVSHGHCMQGPGHVHQGSNATLPETPGIHRVSTHHVTAQHPDLSSADAREGRSLSLSFPAQAAPGTPLFSGVPPDSGRTASISSTNHAQQCVIDSTAYFIRAESTPMTPTKEILIFGDVEPDSISLSPRTAQVWAEAAPKIAAGILTGIFIECSYTNVQGDAVLYGHLAPRHLLAELQALADMVREARKEHEREKESRKGRKRKRASNGLVNAGFITPSTSGAVDGGASPMTGLDAAVRKSSRTRAYHAGDDDVMADAVPPSPLGLPNLNLNSLAPSSGANTPVSFPPASAPSTFNLSSVSAEHSKAVLAAAFEAPLKGLKVVVIHVKDTLADGPSVGDGILEELESGEKEAAERGRGLGCVFEVAASGGSYWF